MKAVEKRIFGEWIPLSKKWSDLFGKPVDFSIEARARYNLDQLHPTKKEQKRVA